jgi:hypothetical protein
MDSLSDNLSGSSIDYLRCYFSGSYVNCLGGSFRSCLRGSFGYCLDGSLIDYTDG